MARSLKNIGSDNNKQNSTADRNQSGITIENQNSINEMVGKYSGKSDDELMRELIEITAQKKSEGTLDSAQIDAVAANIFPMLNEEQAKRLQSILNAIK